MGTSCSLVLACFSLFSHAAILPASRPLSNDEVLIRRALVPKDDTKYSVDGTLSQTITLPTGDARAMSTDVAADLELVAGDQVTDGKLPFTLTVSNLKLASTPQQPGDSRDRKVILSGKVDEQNSMSEINLEGVRKDDQAIAGLVARMAQGVGTFPDKPVTKGDTWTVSEQASFLGGKKLEYTLRFDGEQTVEGVTLYAISGDTDIPVEVDVGVMDSDGQPGTRSGIAMQGTVHVATKAMLYQNGLVYSLQFETKAEMKVDSPDADGQIKLSSDEILNIHRKPAS